MECFSGMGAAMAAGAAASSFNYNRENFKDDRVQRRHAAVKAMSWRVEQAKLWRQDVRDLISLTEYKMHMYLIVNVLVLGFTIFLWTEGRLPAGTPQWLMVGNIISIAAAFMFLLLSIWMAMHAAISAQSYEARLLTQMVRLPIPTWEELEATRTYGSEFEKMEGRQMFRVPYVMGWQENLVGKAPPRDPQPDAADNGDTDDTGEPASPSSPMATMATATESAAMTSNAMQSTRDSDMASGTATNARDEAGEWAQDPWGLEQAGEGTPELGCSLGSDVAKLRHVKLARQAAIQWQTFDAFSRISMSMGVQQMMQAMSYYMIGYLMVQVGNGTAAVLGCIVFTMISNTILCFDVTLTYWQLKIAQALLFIGPCAAAIAGLSWGNYEQRTTEFIVPIAFFSHGLYFAYIAFVFQIKVAENGAWLPAAFRGVLYLDVFSWTRGQASNALKRRQAPPAPETGPQAGMPALQAVRYDDGRPVPLTPQDMAPRGVQQDLSGAPRAPIITRPGHREEGRDEEFYNPASFLQGYEDIDGEITEHHKKEHWSETVGPGQLPWRVFCIAMMLSCSVWIIAGAYCVHGATTDWSLDLSIKELRHRVPKHRPGFLGPRARNGQAWWDDLSSGNSEATWQRWNKDDTVTSVADKSMSLLSASVLSAPMADHLGSSADIVPEQIMLSWPWPNIAPTHLSCDASGSHFVMADRLLMFSASMKSKSSAAPTGKAEKHSAVFTEFDCPVLLGEGLQDVALSCNSTIAAGPGCEVLALHRHGRRLASCPLMAPASGSHVVLTETDEKSVNKVEEISEKWLERPRNHAAEGVDRGQIEKALSIAMSPECKGEVGAEFCTVLGTTHGRVVQLGRHSSKKELIPTEVLYEDPANAASSGMVRAFNRRYLGVLQPEEGSIGLLDLSKGGLPSGKVPLSLSKPVASFCAGGGHVYMLTRGAEPELWRIPVPHELRPEAMLPLNHDSI